MNDINLFVSEEQRSKCGPFVTRFKKVWLGYDLSELDPDILLLLRNRSWLSFSVTTLVRIAQIMSHEGAWFGSRVSCSGDIHTECVGEYNAVVMDPLTPTIG